jgi:SAM-dependent methyltransferase
MPAVRTRLDGRSHDHLVHFYVTALKRFGPDHPLAVWWTSRRAQERRFEVLAEAGPWEGASVADVGCGLGDLFGFFGARGLRVRYSGYDINPAMIEAARTKYPHPRARFEVRDVLASGLPGRFDYVLASGTFNVRVSDHEAWMRDAVGTMYASCRRAVAINLLTPVPPDHPDCELLERLYGDTFYHAPFEPLVEWCRARARRVEVRTGYRVWDASVLMLR